MALIYFLLMMIPIVVVHELGHYWVGRLSGIRAQTFSVGFGPEIFSRKDRHGTIWRIAALPLGGFVRFAPDAAGTNFPNVEPEKPPYTAPFWGKVATVLAGPVFNFVMSFVLFFLFASFNGPQSNEPIIDGVNFYETNLQTGDRIKAVNGQSIDGMDMFYEQSRGLGTPIEVTIERDGEYQNMELPNPNLPIIGAVIPGEPAEKAGLLAGDRIIVANGEDMFARDALAELIQKGAPVTLWIERDGETIEIKVAPEMTNDGVARIGVYFGSIYASKAAGLAPMDALAWAFRSTNWVLVESYKGMRDLITGDVSIEAMSGPVGMSRIATDAADQGFWNFIWLMGMISSAIGFLNLLPIPILDGGHIVLMFYERIFGRLPPQTVLNMLFLLGITLLMGVLMVTTINEVFG